MEATDPDHCRTHLRSAIDVGRACCDYENRVARPASRRAGERGTSCPGPESSPHSCLSCCSPAARLEQRRPPDRLRDSRADAVDRSRPGSFADGHSHPDADPDADLDADPDPDATDPNAHAHTHKHTHTHPDTRAEADVCRQGDLRRDRKRKTTSSTGRRTTRRRAPSRQSPTTSGRFENSPMHGSLA